MGNNSDLTEQEKAWAKNLKRIWDSKRSELGLTQEKAAEKYGCTQGNISQYLHGKIPLNVIAISKFSSILDVKPEEINPDIASYYHDIKTAKDLIPIIKRLSKKEQAKLIGIAEIISEFGIDATGISDKGDQS